ncbi:MAG: LptF/LptG family permease [Desulfobulbus sp.]|nr:LptF/LptG family permease [Desulfobulbus sp.]
MRVDSGKKNGEETAARRIIRWRPPLLLYSYIANELLAPFFASFLILYCVFFLVRLIPLLDIVLGLRIGLADFIRLFAYIFPHMLLYIIPMASMAGVIVGFTRLANDREILAFKACGVSLLQMLPPVLIILAVIACLTGLFSIRLIPAGALGVKQLMFQLAKEKIDKGLKEKEFTEALGDIVLYVDKIDKQQHWHGVYVSDMRGRTQPLVTVAKRGYMHADMEQMLVTVILNDGTLHNTEGMDNQIIRFGRYQLQVSLRPPTTIGKEDVSSQTRGAMTQEQLLAVASQLEPGSKPARIYLSEYYNRMVLPVGCFILGIIGLPLGLQASPGRRAVGVPLGLAVFITYYITLTTCRTLGEAGTLPLAFSIWLPNVIFALIALSLLWRTYQEKSLLPEPLRQLWYVFYESLFKNIHGQIISYLRTSTRSDDSFAATSQASLSETSSVQVHADVDSGIFHLPPCEDYNCPSCRLRFKTPHIAREAGFTPCEFCAALLEEETGKQQ